MRGVHDYFVILNGHVESTRDCERGQELLFIKDRA